jgi:hypothetical protein
MITNQVNTFLRFLPKRIFASSEKAIRTAAGREGAAAAAAAL